MSVLTGTVGSNQPSAPVVSVPWPTSVAVPASQVGVSDGGSAAVVDVASGGQAPGRGVLSQKLNTPWKPSDAVGTGLPRASVAVTVTWSTSMSPRAKPQPLAGVGEAKVKVVCESPSELVDARR